METLDLSRINANRDRVRVLMADGQWHTAGEIRNVGGSEGLRRLREIREGRGWQKRYLGSGLWEYRVSF